MVFSGVADVEQWYPWPFSFPAAHYEVAWITMGAIIAHLGAKWAITRRAIGRRRCHVAISDAEPAIGASAEDIDEGLTRRGFLTVVAAASGVLTIATVGQTVPGLAELALLAPRDPRQRPVNRSAANAGVIQAAGSSDYRLVVAGRVARPQRLSLDDLLAMPTHTVELPIACVEGWSYSARWSGIRVLDLVRHAGGHADPAVVVESLEQHGPYRRSFLDHFQVAADDTLLATHLDGQRLSLDHGYPLRLIGPNRPGVLQTKWVAKVVVL
jgi:DMSO/TMAO reductase YedYZ molybdopterin-dependent catalytic subunit